ncbi:hypothetical protein L6452_21120 [Arctium lappa]|uniref:Uncharacterized protein n=1 Tax=Arctium lappa TaxID=4217 RepID=A0ACB9BDR8_ARCLA|nr:hypothetical protein L6452_21120 [Arctium lappa]
MLAAETTDRVWFIVIFWCGVLVALAGILWVGAYGWVSCSIRLFSGPTAGQPFDSSDYQINAQERGAASHRILAGWKVDCDVSTEQKEHLWSFVLSSIGT